MEFGVHMGFSVNVSAEWRARHCPDDVPTFFGFDTFTGALVLDRYHLRSECRIVIVPWLV